MPQPLQFTANYGNSLLKAEQINNARSRNALMQQEMGPDSLNALNKQYRQKQIEEIDYDMQNPDSAASYNKNPTFVRSADGQGGWVIKAFQLNDRGTEPKEVVFPGGALPAIKGSWVDVGDGKQLLMPYDTTGQSPISAPPQGSPPVATPQSPVTASDNAPTQQLATPNFIPQRVPTVDTPEHKAEVVTQQEQAKVDVKQKVADAKNKRAYATYQVARDNLNAALKNTTTGYFAGKVPAVEAMQQVADNAQRILFPAIKSLVREAGEGVFTDRDALDIQAMMPTRETHPDALPMVQYNIDSYIASKLGQPLPPKPEGAIEPPPAIAADDPRWNQLSNEEKLEVIKAYEAKRGVPE